MKRCPNCNLDHRGLTASQLAEHVRLRGCPVCSAVLKNMRKSAQETGRKLATKVK